MRTQTELLSETDWNVLVILDACRADYFRTLCDARAEVVRSPAPCTRRWFHAMLDGGLLDGACYVNANPVVQDVVTKRDDVPLEVHYFRRGAEGTVYPESLTDRVLNSVRDDGQPERLVVHYLQPHLPNIGSWDEAREAWPDEETCDNRPYAANLHRAWMSVQRLARGLRGRVVITADHGEVLGEMEGRRGHECQWDHPVLYRVPWLELEPGVPADGEGGGWSRGEKDEPDEGEIRERMRKLGYVC